MKRKEFIEEFEKIEPQLYGLGRRIMERAKLSGMPQYYNITGGKIKDPELLQRTYDAAVQVLRERAKSDRASLSAIGVL